jgi:S-adenosylmethionine-diacylglycerol 3-amino-3-carboxypropyl transferase
MPRYFSTAINYTLGDEDSTVELESLGPGIDHVVAVAGSGGRVVPLLARRPGVLTCVDVSDVQLGLTELRIAALRELEREEYAGLLGYEPMPASTRRAIARKLPLSSRARATVEPWLGSGAGDRPLVYEGRFERMLRTLSRVNGWFTRKRGRGLFEQPDLPSQARYVDSEFPTRAWKLVLMLLGNSAALNSLLYRGEFPKQNRPGSAYAIYTAIFDRLFRAIPARKSFFLQMIFFGELRFPEGYPVECSPDVYARAQEGARSGRIEFVRGDVIETVARGPEVGFVSLSDVPSFLPPARERRFLHDMLPGLAPKARVASRGHLRVIEPDAEGFRSVTDDFRKVISAESTQLWDIRLYDRV